MDNSNENRIFTIPNLISFIRLLFIPIFVFVLFQGNNLVAAILYGLVAASDFLDGFVARKTNSVTKLGKILDPAVDSFLMIAAMLSLFIIGRLPLWVVLFIVIRYLILLAGGGLVIKLSKSRIDVLYIGKIGSAFLCFGIAWIIFNLPLLQGFDILPAPYFPGLCAGPYCPGFWLLYIGCVIALFTTIYYTVKAFQIAAKAKK